MVEHTLKFALKNFSNNKILLSTDSPLIRRIGQQYKVLSPWIRPSDISTDSSSSLDVILHSVKWYEKNYNKLDYIILLQPTSPYRNKFTLNKCVNEFLKEKSFTVKTIKIDNNKKKEKKILYFNNTCSPNGSFYIIPRKHIFLKEIHKNQVKHVLILDKKENIDIDNLNDFLEANKY